ncbi:hypothetical protein [Trichlorobacter lovleyi]|uniref:hypothetical protein n=1 Tax=Trichlorobacter lovleyi TaxID=313985 RepID=UPI0023F1919F|nr:hypothetical protein [Trichlorobacter lovleyi]
MGLREEFAKRESAIAEQACNQSELIKALPRTVAEDDAENYSQLDAATDMDADSIGCFTPGTGGCEWCVFADECAG